MASRTERQFVEERAASRCEYCRAPQVVTGVTFHVEHIQPRAHDGADERANYALCCVACNGHKSDHLTGTDPETGADVPLFHPRRDKWNRHFRFTPSTLEIRGTTAKGRATVARLQMNAPRQLQARALWVELELYP